MFSEKGGQQTGATGVILGSSFRAEMDLDRAILDIASLQPYILDINHTIIKEGSEQDFHEWVLILDSTQALIAAELKSFANILDTLNIEKSQEISIKQLNMELLKILITLNIRKKNLKLYLKQTFKTFILFRPLIFG